MSDDDEAFPDIAQNHALKRTVRTVAIFNLGYFGIEFAVALAIGLVALFADSVDFLEDSAVNLLILAGLGHGMAVAPTSAPARKSPEAWLMIEVTTVTGPPNTAFGELQLEARRINVFEWTGPLMDSVQS